ncbi:hypothetical protein C2G38_2229269 [Gigaspora rosea]|uniref:Uncharacterized protein n=1 Tax=Gigaspora rosea TaxID=44941 RepID=A0A397TYA8_9GLOM|nr:hypothetical protein C2G38_2229269 [Gigaspora rosea]
MEIINKYQLSNSAGDAFITFFNKFSNLDISLLPPSTKAGKEFFDNTIVPYMMFKEVPVKIFQNIEYPIVEGPELYFVVCRDIITFIPRISIIIADMVEAVKFTNVYQPSCSRQPCAKCLVSRDDLNNTNLMEIISRTPDAMKQAINSGEDKDYSIHPKKNAFWEIRNFNIYEAIIPDRMHALDLGLFKYMLDYTKELLYEQCGAKCFKPLNSD